MKKKFNFKLLLLIKLLAFIVSSCTINKSNKTLKKYIEGVYCSDMLPSDVGPPYRIYYKFTKEGQVLSMNSSFNCDSVIKIIDKDFAESSTYTLKGNDSLKFKFINNRVNNNKYMPINSGKLKPNKTMRIVSIIKYIDDDPYRVENDYILCITPP